MPDIVAVRPRSLLDDALGAIREKSVDVKIDEIIIGDLPDLVCKGEAYPVFKDALRELLNNSLESFEGYSPSRKPKITYIKLYPGDGFLNINVADNGPGIPLEHRGEIFDPFFTTKGNDHQGLGLSLARTATREYGGDLVLSPSKPESGSSFLLKLPVYRN